MNSVPQKRNTFIDDFINHAEESEKTEAGRIVLKLAAAGINSKEKFLETNDTDISQIKGVGPRSMHVIGKIKTKMEYEAKGKKDAYKKLRGNAVIKDIKFYVQKAGKTYLEACNIDHILKANGIRDMEEFRNAPIDNFKYFGNVGPKRFETIKTIQKMAISDYKRKSRS